MLVDAPVVIRQVFLRWKPKPPKLNRTSLFGFLFIMATLVALFALSDGRVNPLYSSIHFVIIAVSMLHIMWVRRFNLGLSFSFFSLFFFGIIPLFEYRFGITYSGAYTPEDASYMKAAGVALLSCLCFYLGYGLKRGTSFNLESLKSIRYLSVRHRQLVVWTSVVVIVLAALFISAFYQFKLFKLLFRGYSEESDQSAIGYSFVNYVARPLVFNLVFLMILIWTRRNRIPYGKIAVLCGVAGLFVSPLGIPRSLAGALYIPLVMMAFMPRFNSKYAQLVVIILAILFLAPLADVFRFINSEHSQVDLGSNFNLEYLFSGHFDAFHNLTQVIETKYKSEGWQVVGILLFWVPRDLWEGKPNGTAVDFAEYAGFSADNVSFPLPAEFLVDYGITGVVVGMIVTGFIYRRLDALLSKPQRAGSLSSYLFELSHLEMSILGLYLLRGSVLVSFAFTVGVASTLVVISYGDKLLRGAALAALDARRRNDP
jgi:oligosaccharide repeat unit polymerase